jgi:hypothetical protein
MKKIITVFEQMPKWYALGIAVLYGIVLAEFFSTVTHLMPPSGLENTVFYSVLMKIMYGVTALSGIVVLIVSTFLFHLTAMLFNGKAVFKHFLKVAAYPYIVPAIMVLVAIFVLDGVQIFNAESGQIPDAANAAAMILENPQFKLAMWLVNLSFIPYYIMIAIIIHYIHGIKWLFAALSVIIPIASIWGISQLLMKLL